MVKTPINSTPIRAIAVCFATALKRGLRSSFAAALILHFTAPAAEPLALCPRCGTGIPASSPACPVCGLPRH